MQHAHEDERIGKGKPCPERDQSSRSANQHETTPEGTEIETLRIGERERNANQREKRCGNAARNIHPPFRLGDVELDETEKAEIPREMIGDHRHDREPAQYIDARTATGRRTSRSGGTGST